MLNHTDTGARAGGTVYLVGAGPGDPGLVTLRAARLLRRAEVVIHDALIDRALLRIVSRRAEVIDVGKRCGGRRTAQEEINRLMIEAARTAETVVRLKGGDPFLFGRGGEEALALREAGVPFVVVPGVTAAAGVSAYAGIPLTHRDIASSVTLVTGHEDTGRRGTRVDWGSIARLEGTIAIYMGVAKLPYIVERLLGAGRAPATPAAIVEWGTYARQRTVAGRLADLPELARRNAVGAPALVVIGDVAALRERLAWFDTLPLRGRTILVGRARAQTSRLATALRELGAEVLEHPAFHAEPLLVSDADLDHRGQSGWILFTAPAAVAHFWKALRRSGRDSRAVSRQRIASLGRATTAALRRRGLEPDMALRTFAPEAVVQGFTTRGGLQGTPVLFPQAEGTHSPIAAALSAAGAHVRELPVFRLVPDFDALSEAEALSADLVVLASSTSAVLVAPVLRASAALVIAIGSNTADTARRAGLNVVTVAEEPTIDGLVRATLDHFAETDSDAFRLPILPADHLASVGGDA